MAAVQFVQILNKFLPLSSILRSNWNQKRNEPLQLLCITCQRNLAAAPHGICELYINFRGRRWQQPAETISLSHPSNLNFNWLETARRLFCINFCSPEGSTVADHNFIQPHYKICRKRKTPTHICMTHTITCMNWDINYHGKLVKI